MLRTIGRFGITLLVVSTLEITISSRNPLLARARGITSYSSNLSSDLSAETAEVPEELAPNRSTSPSSRPSELREGTEGSPTSSGAVGVVCISGCRPEYPSVLNGEEGRAVVRVVLDSNGNVVDWEIAESGGSSQLNQEALEAARKMKFRVPGGASRFAVQLPINFTIRGSDFARQARERQAQLERDRLERERQEQQQQERQQREGERQIPPSSRPRFGLSCVSGCTPKYPAVLAGEEGSARVRLMVDRNGNVVEAQVVGGSAFTEFSVDANGNVAPKDGETTIYSQLAEAALAATKQMKFAPLESGDRIQAIVQIHFTRAGSNFDRQVRERRTQNGREVQVEEMNLAPLN